MGPVSPRVIVQPDDGVQPVRDFIASAQKSLLIKQFTFTEPSLVATVIERHRAGVAVRVMLNPARSGGDRANDETFEQFSDAGVNVQWSNPSFYVTHEKSIVVDETAALVATFNLCEKYFTLTRDYGFITTVPEHVAQIVEVFDADWSHTDWEPSQYHGLLWSNSNSRYHMAKFIDTAEHHLRIQHPKYVDAVILDHIAAAVGRGVNVHVLCGGKHGISDWDILDTFASLRLLESFGVKVRRQKHLKLHAKLLIIDDQRAQLGSMNIDRSAFDLRRELGIVVSDGHIIKALTKVFDHDWHESKPYEAPDPLQPDKHHEGELPHDPHFLHE